VKVIHQNPATTLQLKVIHYNLLGMNLCIPFNNYNPEYKTRSVTLLRYQWTTTTYSFYNVFQNHRVSCFPVIQLVCAENGIYCCSYGRLSIHAITRNSSSPIMFLLVHFISFLFRKVIKRNTFQ
jgi:hypothetical protein